MGDTPRGFPQAPFLWGKNSSFIETLKAFLPADFCVSKKRKEENEVFLKPFSAFLRVSRRFAPRVVALRAPVARLRREYGAAAPSASGGLKPFSEEKGFKNSKKTFFATRTREARSKKCPSLLARGKFYSQSFEINTFRPFRRQVLPLRVPRARVYPQPSSRSSIPSPLPKTHSAMQNVLPSQGQQFPS